MGRNKREKEFKVESIQSLPLKDPQTGELLGVMRVWTRKRKLEPFEIDDQFIHDAAKKYHAAYPREIAREIFQLNAITRVEWVSRNGDGFVLEED